MATESKPSYSVSELCDLVDATIRDTFDSELWVRGIISGLTRSANGHVYFDLIDPSDLGRSPDATLPVALFANAKQRVNAILRKTNATRMEDGIEIRIRGQVTYYPRQGRIQLIMSLIDPAYTLGQLEAAKAELLRELESDGLAAANSAVPFPILPLRIGLVTSSGSAAEADFLHELELSGYPFDVTLFDSRVQGDEAVPDLATAILAAAATEVDLVAIVRGGGARTDLVAFDHGRVARAIAAAERPVVVGVGHETDLSVADQVAARSAKTPTACAGLIIDVVRQFDQRVERCSEAIAHLAGARVVDASQRLDRLTARLNRVAADSTGKQQSRLDVANSRLATGAIRTVERASHRLATATIRIDALDPQVALARGWSITQDATGKVIRSVDDVALGAELVTTVADGKISSTSTQVTDRRQTPSQHEQP